MQRTPSYGSAFSDAVDVATIVCRVLQTLHVATRAYHCVEWQATAMAYQEYYEDFYHHTTNTQTHTKWIAKSCQRLQPADCLEEGPEQSENASEIHRRASDYFICRPNLPSVSLSVSPCFIYLVSTLHLVSLPVCLPGHLYLLTN